MCARVHSNERFQTIRRQAKPAFLTLPISPLNRARSKAALCGIANQFMKILLYNPDNGVTRNFMPHLWMFLLQALTPAGPRSAAGGWQRQPDGRSGNRAVCARQQHWIGRHRRHDPNDCQGVSHGGRGSRHRSSGGDGRTARDRDGRRGARPRWRAAPRRRGRAGRSRRDLAADC